MTSLRSAAAGRVGTRRRTRSPPAVGWAILQMGHGHDAPVDNDGAHVPRTILRVAHMPTPPAAFRQAQAPPKPRTTGAFGDPPLPGSVRFDRIACSLSTETDVRDDPK